jgi:hypothetical protein
VPGAVNSAWLGAETDMADEYRRNAAECAEIADRMNDAGCKSAMRVMATVWKRLAEREQTDTSKQQKPHEKLE